MSNLEEVGRPIYLPTFTAPVRGSVKAPPTYLKTMLSASTWVGGRGQPLYVCVWREWVGGWVEEDSPCTFVGVGRRVGEYAPAFAFCGHEAEAQAHQAVQLALGRRGRGRRRRRRKGEGLGGKRGPFAADQVTAVATGGLTGGTGGSLRGRGRRERG